MWQFKRVIHLFENFEILLRKMTCLNQKIKRKMKLKKISKVFQIKKNSII